MIRILTMLAVASFANLICAAVPYDHVHLTATNAREAVNWYSKHFGGTPGSFNRGDADVVEYPTDRVFYGDLSVIFFEREPTGGSVGTTVYGSTIFQTISSVTTSATASGNIKVGTLGYNAINDDDSLVEWSSFSSGSLTMDGVLSTSNYLGAKIKIKSEQDTTGTSFVIAGLGLNNQVITETITGSNSGCLLYTSPSPRDRG